MHRGSDLAAISLDGRAEIRWLYTAGFLELRKHPSGETYKIALTTLTRLRCSL